MLSIQEVTNLLNKNPRKFKIPDIIRIFRDVYYDISLHTTGACPRYFDSGLNATVTPPYFFGEEYQIRFDRFLLNKYPREDTLTRSWRYSQYRPFTKAPFQQICETVIGAIFQDSNYSIELNNPKDQEYIYSNNFDGKDLISYFKWSFQHIIEDPNGLFVRIPKYSYDKTTTDIEPQIWFVPSTDLYSIGEEEILFKRGEYVYQINKIAIFRYALKNGKWELENDGYYAHMFGYIPYNVAGGIWNTQGFLDSWINKAIPVANDFIGSKSDKQLTDKEASTPWIVEVETDCPECSHTGRLMYCETCKGLEGFCTCDEPTWENRKCGKCNGSGSVSHNPGQRIISPADKMQHPLVQVINPDVSINKYHADNNKDVYWQILDALNLTKIEQAQSGTAKAIDQERLYLFISMICNDLFDRVIHDTIKDFIAYRNVISYNGEAMPSIYDFKVIKPSQFQIKTASDLLNEYQVSTTANLPAFLRSRMFVDYADKEYGGDMLLKRKAKLIEQLDPICVYDKATISTMIIGGQIGLRDAQFSIKLPLILDELAREKGQEWFCVTDFDVIEEAAMAIFDAETPETPPLTNDNGTM